MPLDRTTIVRGPAQIEFPAGTGKFYYSQGDIRVNIGHEVFDIVNSAYGLVEQRSRQRTATFSFTPVGQFTSGVGGDLWIPYGSLKAGNRFLGNTDQNAVIWSYAGTRVTVYNVGITKMADLILATTRTLAGEITFTGLGKGIPLASVTAGSYDANSLVLVETGVGAPADVFDPSTIITETYTVAWGNYTSPWNDLKTQNGWVVAFDLGLQPVEIDSHGLIDWTVGSVRATARAQLLGVSEVDAIAKVRPDIARGSAIISDQNLVITGSALIVTLHNTQVRLIPAQYGLTTVRLAELEFLGTRKVVANVLQDVFTVAHT